MVVNFDEARRMANRGRSSPAEKEARKLTLHMLYGWLHGRGDSISYHIFSYTDTKITEILTKTFMKRKEYYLQKPWSNFHTCNIGGSNSPVRIPFRYIEEVLMVFSLLYSDLKDKKSYSVLNPEMKKVMKYLKQHVDVDTSINPNLTKVFINSIKTFNQKLITKCSYIINRLPEKKLDTFLNVFFTALKESKVIRNLFVLSYDYFINEERNMMVLDSCYLNDRSRRAFKFEFDSYYWSRDILVAVLATRYDGQLPNPPLHTLKHQAATFIQRVFRERLQPRIQRRTKAAIVIQRHVRQLPRIKAARTIQSVVRRHRATNKNSRLSINAITLEHIPRRNSIALNGQMYHRNSIASLVALGNARVPHTRRRIDINNNGRYYTY